MKPHEGSGPLGAGMGEGMTLSPCSDPGEPFTRSLITILAYGNTIQPGYRIRIPNAKAPVGEWWEWVGVDECVVLVNGSCL